MIYSEEIVDMSLEDLQKEALDIKSRIEKEIFVNKEWDDFTSARKEEARAKQLKAVEEPVRRSDRTRRLSTVGLINKGLISLDDLGGQEAFYSKKKPVDVEYSKVDSIKPLPSATDRTSTRAMKTRFDWMNNYFLGRMVPCLFAGGNAAKRSVVHAVVNRGYGDGLSVKFNQLSGIQQFADNMILFVNLFKDEDSPFPFENEIYLKDGELMLTWYGSMRMTSIHQTLQSIVHHKTGLTVSGGERVVEEYNRLLDEKNSKKTLMTDEKGERDIIGNQESEKKSSPTKKKNNSNSDDILYEPMRIGTALRLSADLPYIWAGELEYVSHEMFSSPVKFQLRFKHSEELVRLSRDSKFKCTKVDIEKLIEHHNKIADSFERAGTNFKSAESVALDQDVIIDAVFSRVNIQKAISDLKF